MRTLLLTALLVVTGCATTPASEQIPLEIAASTATGHARLVVGMSDGSVVQQTAAVKADVCLRSVPLAVTVCYAKGSPRIDPRTNEIMGYAMVTTMLSRD